MVATQNLLRQLADEYGKTLQQVEDCLQHLVRSNRADRRPGEGLGDYCRRKLETSGWRPLGTQDLPPAENHYQWKTYTEVEVERGQKEMMLLTAQLPEDDSEVPIGELLFEDEDAAEQYLADIDYLEQAIEENWILVRTTFAPVKRLECTSESSPETSSTKPSS